MKSDRQLLICLAIVFGYAFAGVPAHAQSSDDGQVATRGTAKIRVRSFNPFRPDQPSRFSVNPFGLPASSFSSPFDEPAFVAASVAPEPSSTESTSTPASVASVTDIEPVTNLGSVVRVPMRVSSGLISSSSVTAEPVRASSQLAASSSGRPPYRPPVRSPYRPPPRPPF